MYVRSATANEFQEIYEQGYREWAKGRSFEEFIKDNQKEEAYGTRIVLTNDQNQIMASLMLLCFQPHLIGIGSIVVDPSFRKQGVGKKMVEECLKMHPEAAYILYSEIAPGYYEQFGFRVLPNRFQQSPKGICMIRAEGELFERIMEEEIPGYF